MDFERSSGSLSMSEEDMRKLFVQYIQTRDIFVKACLQVHTLDRKLSSLRERLERVTSSGHRAFITSYGLQVATLEGVREMYETFARSKSEQLSAIADVIEKTPLWNVVDLWDLNSGSEDDLDRSVSEEDFDDFDSSFDEEREIAL